MCDWLHVSHRILPHACELMKDGICVILGEVAVLTFVVMCVPGGLNHTYW